jgi:hypothetical protein
LPPPTASRRERCSDGYSSSADTQLGIAHDVVGIPHAEKLDKGHAAELLQR